MYQGSLDVFVKETRAYLVTWEFLAFEGFLVNLVKMDLQVPLGPKERKEIVVVMVILETEVFEGR